MGMLRKSFFVLLLLLLISPIANVQAADLDVGVWGGDGCCDDGTRGYWFVAPVDFTITGLSVPTNGPGDVATIEVLRFNSIPAGVTINDFTQLGYWSGVTTTAVNIQVSAGDIIGVLGWADFFTPYRDDEGAYSTTLGGQPVTLTRLGFQDLGEAYDVWADEPDGSIGVIGLEYELVSAAAIPTLSEWGMIILSLLLGGFAVWYMRKQSHKGSIA